MQLKITSTDLGTLRVNLAQVLDSHPKALDQYRGLDRSHESFRWDLFNLCDTVFKRDLYEYLHDNHIDSALRSILGTTYESTKQQLTDVLCDVSGRSTPFHTGCQKPRLPESRFCAHHDKKAKQAQG
jgi:hypothetical protein